MCGYQPNIKIIEHPIFLVHIIPNYIVSQLLVLNISYSFLDTEEKSYPDLELLSHLPIPSEQNKTKTNHYQ